MTVSSHDMQTVTALVDRINDDSDGTPLHRVTEVGEIVRSEHGVAVTLTVQIPSRTKGLRAGDEDGQEVHDQWEDLQDES